MFDSRGRSADPRFGVNVPCSGYRTEPAKHFRFAITWTSLTRHLDLREAVHPTSAIASIAVPPLQRSEPQPDSKARWEMVVPKMVRADRESKASTIVRVIDNRNGRLHPPISIPTLTCLENARPRFLARAFAVIERCTRSLVAGPAKTIDGIPLWSGVDSPRLALANGRSSRLQVLQLNAPSFPIPSENQIGKIEGVQDRDAARELLLSKITNTLRSRSGGA